MKKDFVIKEVSVEEALKVFPKIKEWDRPEAWESFLLLRKNWR